MSTISKSIMIRIAPRKARLVMDVIRHRKAIEALQILNVTNKKAALLIKKTLKSAIANATNNDGYNEEDLIVIDAFANDGPTIKRIKPRARGSASKINKRTSHFTIIVGNQEELNEARTVKKAKNVQAKINRQLNETNKKSVSLKNEANAARKLATAGKKPATAAKKPATAAKKPATAAKKPATAAKKPATAAKTTKKGV